MSGKYVVDHQACDSSVAVLEGVDSDVAVVEEGGELYWREFSALFFFVVPVHEVCHQCRGFFRGCVFEAVSVTGDHAVGTGFVLSCVDDIATLLATGEFCVDGVVFADEGFVELADEVLCQWHIFQSGLLLHHLQADVAGFHFFEIFHLCFAGDLAEEKEELCLSVGEGVAFDVVAVEVEVNGEFAAVCLSKLLLLW